MHPKSFRAWVGSCLESLNEADGAAQDRPTTLWHNFDTRNLSWVVQLADETVY